jgi:hypothetical protein
VLTSGYRASATYEVDKLAATLAYYKNNTNSVPATPDAHGTVLGCGYTFSAFTLKGLYVAQVNAPLNSLKTIGIGGAYELTPDLTFDFGVEICRLDAFMQGGCLKAGDFQGQAR